MYPRCAEIHGGAGDVDGVRPPTDPITSLHDHDVDACEPERPRGNKSRDTSTDHHDTGHLAGHRVGQTRGSVADSQHG
jgi:hypothetical protein